MDTTPFSWVISHLAVLGWPAVLYAAYRIIVACIKIGRAATLVEQRVLDGEKTLYLLANNHLPHIQAAIEDSNKIMQGIRDDLKMLMVKD
jgi:hypothetical protein